MSELNFLYSTAKERQLLKDHFSNMDNLDPNKKTILFTTPSETGTSYFRVLTPMFAMAEKAPDAFNYVYCEKEEFPIEWLHKVDVWVQHRAGSIHAHYLNLVRKFPVDITPPAVVHDIDDDEVNLPPNHSMRDMWYGTKKHELAKFQLSHCDKITTTGRMLKKEFTKYKKFDNVKIFRNAFNWDLPQWNLEKPDTDYVTIGWAGLTSHMDDLKKMAKILMVIHNKYPDVKFKIAGITNKDEQYRYVDDGKGNKKLVKEAVTDYKQTYHYRVSQLFKDFDSDRIELLGVLSMEEYGKFYTMWDINLAYVEHNGFNSRKSEIKVVEGSRYNNINIYSNIGGYQEYTNSLPTELKKIHLKYCAMKTEQLTEWVNAISFWVDAHMNNDSIVDTVKSGCREFVTEKYSIYNQVDERVNFYNDMISKKLSVRVL